MTKQTSNANNTANSTNSRGSSLPETHQKAAMTKSEIAMRIELRTLTEQLDQAAQSTTLTDWERGFTADLAKRLKQYGLATRLSAEQLIRMQYAIRKASAH